MSDNRFYLMGFDSVIEIPGEVGLNITVRASMSIKPIQFIRPPESRDFRLGPLMIISPDIVGKGKEFGTGTLYPVDREVHEHDLGDGVPGANSRGIVHDLNDCPVIPRGFTIRLNVTNKGERPKRFMAMLKGVASKN